MERLLTDEEIDKAVQDAEDKLDEESGGEAWLSYRGETLVIAKAQDAKTLKAVGGSIDDFIQMHLYARPDKPIATMKFEDWMDLKRIIESLKRGEMPEEGK